MTSHYMALLLLGLLACAPREEMVRLPRSHLASEEVSLGWLNLRQEQFETRLDELRSVIEEHGLRLGSVGHTIEREDGVQSSEVYWAYSEGAGEVQIDLLIWNPGGVGVSGTRFTDSPGSDWAENTYQAVVEGLNVYARTLGDWQPLD